MKKLEKIIMKVWKYTKMAVNVYKNEINFTDLLYKITFLLKKKIFF